MQLTWYRARIKIATSGYAELYTRHYMVLVAKHPRIAGSWILWSHQPGRKPLVLDTAQARRHLATLRRSDGSPMTDPYSWEVTRRLLSDEEFNDLDEEDDAAPRSAA